MGLKGITEAVGDCRHGGGGTERVRVVVDAGHERAASTKASSSGGTATMALDENLAGFNINTSAANEFVLQEIMNMVWPQAFIVNNKLQARPEQPAPARARRRPNQDPQTDRLQAQPQGRVVGRHADHGRRLHLQLAGAERRTPPTPTSAASPTTPRRPPATTRSSPSSAPTPSGGAACDPGTQRRPQRGPVPERRHGHGHLQAVVRRLARPLQQHRPGPHRPDRRLEHRLHRPAADHLGQLVRDPELQRRTSRSCWCATPSTGARPASSTSSSSSSSRTTASSCRPCRTRRSTSSTRRR